MIGRRLAHSHSLGAGLVLGLLVAGHSLYVFGAGVVVGVLLVLAVRVARRLVGAARTGGRLLRRAAGELDTEAPAGAPQQTEGRQRDGAELPPAELSELEREQARREGLRQGEAAGIRAAARRATQEAARRQEMSERLEEHWRDERRRSVERAVTS
jgi:hypothetical protein